jgi:hypothetical protein
MEVPHGTARRPTPVEAKRLQKDTIEKHAIASVTAGGSPPAGVRPGANTDCPSEARLAEHAKSTAKYREEVKQRQVAELVKETDSKPLTK